MKLATIATVMLLLSACAPPQDGCGLIGCVTTPMVRARGQGLVGSTVETAISRMGGAPTSTFDLAPSKKVLTWNRSQYTPDAGTLACAETLTVTGAVVTGYERRGNCGSH